MVAIANDNSDNLVEPEYGCPKCGERDADRLVWRDEQVECRTCGTVYEPRGPRDGN
jgi:uncharacterized Zn finger protein